MPEESARTRAHDGAFMAPAASKLTIDERRVGAVTVLKLTGDMLLDDGDVLFRARIHGLLAADRTKIVLNFAGVSHVDSSGVGMLVAKQQTIRKAGGDIRLAHLSPRYLALLATMKVLPMFGVFDDEASAIRSFSDA